ncbi:MAG TPA: M10 family metallopeptidase C-terminal domain-containing protein [Allosphingosinicella sp.]|nr:M10 family metallopeptidase C-terminal domain-containing protein [Allosphingosinicella sp.]
MTIHTGNGRDDYLTAWADGDVLIGNGGNDFLSANGFAVRAEGGAGNDLYSIHSAACELIETRLGGSDTVWYYAADPFVLPDHVENIEFFSSAGTDATGNALANLIVGNEGANRLVGLGGDDTLRGAGGGDRLDGGDGNDLLDPGSGVSLVSTGFGRDVLYVNKEAVEAHVTVGDFDLSEDSIQVRGFWDYSVSEQGSGALVTFSPYVTVLLEGVDAAAVGGQHFDFAPRPDEHTFVGTDRSESLYGWASGDSCYGLDGDDYLGDHEADWSYFHGGKGNDHYEVNNPLDQVIEAEGEGRDLVWLFMAGGYVMPDHVEDINVMGAGEITGNASANAIQGSGGDDVIRGLGGDDVIRANFGADLIEGGDGDDLIDGGGGDSILVGGAGADTFFVEWESGNHVVRDFNIAEDRFEAGSFARFEELQQIGDDTLVVFWTGYGGDTNAMTSALLQDVAVADLRSENFLFVQAGTIAPDKLTGGSYGDELSGAGGEDALSGQGGQDALSGGTSDDRLRGGAGNDTLRGGNGADLLIGHSGRDLLIGGGGGDVYLFRSVSDSRPDAADRILGFDAAAGDMIDLSAIDADAGADGDQAFAFVEAFTGAAGEAVLAYDAARDQSFLSLDVDGDALADFGLLAVGQLSLDAGWAL